MKTKSLCLSFICSLVISVSNDATFAVKNAQLSRSRENSIGQTPRHQKVKPVFLPSNLIGLPPLKPKIPKPLEFMGSKAKKGRRFCFIIDRSVSMSANGVWENVQSELNMTLRTHEGEGQFYVIFYGDGALQRPSKMWIRKKKDVDKLIKWLKSIKAKGKTRPLAALKIAFALEPLPDVIFFVSNGVMPKDTYIEIQKLKSKVTRPVVINTIQFDLPEKKRLANPLVRDFPSEAPGQKAIMRYQIRHMQYIAKTTGGSFTLIKQLKPNVIARGKPKATELQSLITEINAALPPPRMGHKNKQLNLAKLPPIDPKVLAKYKREGYMTEAEFLKKKKQFPLRFAVVRAKRDLQQNYKSFQFRHNLDGANKAQLMQHIVKELQKPGKCLFFLESASEELAAAGKHLDKEPSHRWRAHYLLVSAALKARLIYTMEYATALGEFRRGKVAALKPAQTGYQLVPRKRLSSREVKARTWQRELRKLWRLIIDDHPGTPWAFVAMRERDAELGLEWRAIATKQ